LSRGVDPILRILFHSAGWRVGDKAIAPINHKIESQLV
jgi:hypothetical protein